jgi:hypothetical protein
MKGIVPAYRDWEKTIFSRQRALTPLRATSAIGGTVGIDE